jgi:probable HAF family extracellular repeat protein
VAQTRVKGPSIHCGQEIIVNAFLLAAALCINQNSAPKYKVVDLGTLAGGSYSGANSINSRGEIVGWSDTGGVSNRMLHTRAVLWRKGSIQALKTPEDHYLPTATKINDEGQALIVPEAHAAANTAIDVVMPSYTLLWKDGKVTESDMASPTGLNNRGELAGQGRLTRAAVWQSGKQNEIAGLPAAQVSIAYDLNDAGDVVGCSTTQDGKSSRAFLFHDGALADLGIPAGLVSSQAQSVNEHRQVLVWAYTPTGHAQAFLWEAGRYTPLCAPTEEDIWAYGLNNKGQVVGSAAGRAFLWSGGKRWDLNAFLPKGSGWTLTEAKSINDKGQIVGTGRYRGRERAFLLSPAVGALQNEVRWR